VSPGRAAGLASRPTDRVRTRWPDGDGGRQLVEEDLAEFVQELERAQELLFASATNSVLVVLQAQDAAGKDGTIKHVMSGVNPQGCRVYAFKQPSREELAHDFLWRYQQRLPARGEIVIFNRSYYEEVLVVRVHPELLARAESSPPPDRFWRRRFQDINAFERHLHRQGTRVVKVFLHVSPEEQRRRLLERLEDPRKWWKFSPGDLAERRLWDAYQRCYEEAITATSTSWAPWHVVPADHKYQLRALVGGLVVDAISQLDMRLPAPGASMHEEMDRARRELLGY
jgi:PPK2 family polyphosphate:nucleotide phosphotransferase